MSDATAEQPAPTRVVYLELWRPTFGTFWRECLPAPPFTPGPWRVMDLAFYRKVRQMANSYFTLDDHPGVTFCAREFDAPTGDDWQQVRKLKP